MTSIIRICCCFFALLSLSSTAQAEPFDLTGMLEPSKVVAISSQVPGILEEIAAERGDRVKKDQVLAKLKSGVQKAAVALAGARVEFGKRKATRNEDLYQKQLISIHEKDELETEVQISEFQLQEAVERLDLCTIRSTIRGVVVKRSHEPGEYVGEEDSILTVVRIDPLYVKVMAPLEKYGVIRKGMRAKVFPEAPVGGEYRATVTIVDPVVDAASGNFGVRLQLPNPSNRLPAGVRCRVRFLGE